MALSYQRIDDDYIMEKCCLHTIVQESITELYSTLFIEKGLCLDSHMMRMMKFIRIANGCVLSLSNY